MILIFSKNVRTISGLMICQGCGIEITKVEEVRAGFDLAEIYSVEISSGNRHPPNCKRE